MWITDPKTKEKSVTLTAFITGFMVATLKLLISGAEIGSVKLGVFSGGEFAAAVGALGAIYVMRRHKNQKES